MPKQIILKDVIVKHNVSVATKYGETHVIIFYDPVTNNTWSWKTSSSDKFYYIPHSTYSISATDEGHFNLSHVKEIKSKVTKEQVIKAKKCLEDNGIDPTETATVLQALGYILLDEELESLL